MGGPRRAWQRHAERFFASRVGLTVDKTYDGDPPRDRRGARRRGAARGGAPLLAGGAAFASAGDGRGRTRILDAAGRAERGGSRPPRAGEALPPGLWLVQVEGEPDIVALRLAAILAGVLLGPILAPPPPAPGGAALFGLQDGAGAARRGPLGPA